MVCAASHAAELVAAGCADADIQSFCGYAPPPPLVQGCGGGGCLVGLSTSAGGAASDRVVPSRARPFPVM